VTQFDISVGQSEASEQEGRVPVQHSWWRFGSNVVLFENKFLHQCSELRTNGWVE